MQLERGLKMRNRMLNRIFSSSANLMIIFEIVHIVVPAALFFYTVYSEILRLSGIRLRIILKQNLYR